MSAAAAAAFRILRWQGEWERALLMLEEIRAAGIKVSGMNYSAAIKVCMNDICYDV